MKNLRCSMCKNIIGMKLQKDDTDKDVFCLICIYNNPKIWDIKKCQERSD